MSALARPLRPLADPSRLLQSRVADLRIARRRASATLFAIRGVAFGGAAAAVVGGIAQVTNSELGPFAAATVFASIIAACALFGWRRQPPLVQIALEIDRLLGLDERVTTALELSERPELGQEPVTRPSGRLPSRASRSTVNLSSLAGQQVADAAAVLSPAATASLYQLRVPRRVQALATAGLIAAVLPWLVPWPVLLRTYLPPSPVAVASQAEASRLDSVARQLQSDPAAPDPATRAQVAAQLQKAATALRQSGGNTQSARQALQNADQAMAAAAPQSTSDASQTLARIADALNNNAATQSVTQALDAQDAGKAAAQMSQVAQSLSGMTAQQRADLASALQSASDATRSTDSAASAQLQQAANAAKSDNAAGVQQAAQTLQQLGATSSAQQDVTQGRSELQASQQTLSSASQNGQAATNGSPSADPSSPSQPSSNAAPSDSQSSGQNGTPNQSASAANASSGTGSQSGSADSGNQSAGSGSQPGSGSGSGSTSHVGAPSDPQNLAQRQVMVPSNGPVDQGSVGLSNQTQTGTPGSAQVDYANVLPQYRSQALQNISGNDVPTGLQQVVKGYFDSLAPK